MALICNPGTGSSSTHIQAKKGVFDNLDPGSLKLAVITNSTCGRSYRRQKARIPVRLMFYKAAQNHNIAELVKGSLFIGKDLKIAADCRH